MCPSGRQLRDCCSAKPLLLLLLHAIIVLPGVTHVAVKPWKDGNGTYRLAGYVAPDSVDLAAAEAHCRAKLLPAMVSCFAVLQSLNIL
jgi:hypothetical protein